MSPSVSAAGGSGASSGASGSSAAASAGSVDKNMFLQLLVAQLRNQDPLNPTDGTQFVGQLAQFQQLEESVNMGQDLSAIRQDLDALVQSAAQAQS
jgi:flagellar basal-body rod modification protein FlgD